MRLWLQLRLRLFRYDRNRSAYIRTHAAKMCEAALKFPELLPLMCREKLIGADVFPDFLDESLRRESVEAAAFLLEYQQSHLTDAAFPQDDDLSLD